MLTKRFFFIGCILTIITTGCTRLTAQEQAHYSSRVYPLPYERVFEAVKERVSDYPMGLKAADQAKGLVTSRIGGATSNIGAAIGYQIMVSVTAERERTRVTPAWRMNISSEPTSIHMLPVGIDERPLMYMEFFDALDVILSGPSSQGGS